MFLVAFAQAAEPEPLDIRVCAAPERVLPTAMSDVLSAVVVVSDGRSSGSGFLVSPDGFVLTADHVVEGTDPEALTVRLADGGIELPARVIRRSATHDTALLRIDGSNFRCLGTAEADISGTDLYVVGAPLGELLQASVSRGIVSAVRERDAVRLVQTDATINPGNSGGPMVDPRGRAVGVVSFKLVHEGLEGLGFGVAVSDAMLALGTRFSERTSEVVVPPAAAPVPAEVVAAQLPLPAPVPSGLGTPLVVSGTVIASAGAVAVSASLVWYATSFQAVPRSDWHWIQATEATGWVCIAGGTGLALLGASSPDRPGTPLTMAVSPSGLKVVGTF